MDRISKKCVSLWEKFYAVPTDCYTTSIYPEKYFKDWLGEDYDPCMQSHDALVRKLSEFNARLEPELKRKKQLYSLIVAYVKKQQVIQRSVLMKIPFEGYTADEVRHCYNKLIKQNRLKEWKEGNRYFTALSDSEKAKHRK